MSFGVYIHYPFCVSKCPYCDFNSHVSDTVNQAEWAEAYEREIAFTAEKTKDKIVSTIFFGGGTPSLMKPETVSSIIQSVKKHWRISNDIEITLEANPTSTEAEKFIGFKEAGVNRLSLGIQSLRDQDLKFLGRAHDVAEAKKAIKIASTIFDRFSFDLIYARPEQTLDDWRKELKEALDLAVSHISLYQLTIEKHTPFYTQFQRGDFKILEQDSAADFYDLTQEILGEAGLPAYEVSNHARASEESRHNLIYWRSDDYAGIGPGAHGRLTLSDHVRYATRAHRAPDIWLNRALQNGHGLHEFEVLTPLQNFEEMVMMGLRVREGIAWARLERCNPEKRHALQSSKAYKIMCDEGFLTEDNQGFRATAEGLKRLNTLLSYILA